ncbi:hypothetical protein CABS01_11904 [Colletotrichum abscissum]|uniref:uncharacterized protein n=1 Tax=Colletotrichum abscissum TaxID=1671311 RepID=UPI0027D5A394|nr:uncharacterized protein CABS01_11904 [Colletotrichum abscissum]KAK1492387.1 hypothetical protein CABS01_11904 [Colletotrichum abscissum]
MGQGRRDVGWWWWCCVSRGRGCVTMPDDDGGTITVSFSRGNRLYRGISHPLEVVSKVFLSATEEGGANW